jgi:hypothetical protein
VLEGILWLLLSGGRWEDIDKKKYASFQTCHATSGNGQSPACSRKPWRLWSRSSKTKVC